VKRVIVLLYIISCSTLHAQVAYNKPLLDTLQQVKESHTIAKHFADLYYESIVISNKLLQKSNAPELVFIEKFEAQFAPLFFKQFYNYLEQKPINTVWEYYFANKKLNDLQYKFIGMNAHINGDMATALINAHPLDSIVKYKNHILKFQKAFNTFFDSIIVTTLQYKRVKALHNLSLGLDKYIGRRMVYRWRKKAVHMALLWYSNKDKYYRCRSKLDYKMQRINKFALNNLK
jgi:hypothetical protein